MAKDDSVKALKERYNRLVQNGKNADGTGVLRRIQREIRHAEQREREQQESDAQE